MKILHVITTINRGGAENHLYALSSGMIEKGCEICVVYLKGDGYWENEYNSLGIKTINLKVGRYFSSFIPFIKLRKIAKQFSPDIIHCHLPPAELYTWLSILFLKDMVLVISKHLDNTFFKGSEGQSNGWISRYLCRLISSRAVLIIAISDAVKNYFVNSKIGIDQSKIKVIKYGLSTNVYHNVTTNQVNNLRDQWGIRSDELLIGTVSRLVKQKSIEVILKAFSNFNQANGVRSRLVIVGMGPEKEKLVALCKQLAIDKEIVWAGFREDIPVVMSSFDIFALSSQYEGFGLVLLEAMAAKTPIVSIDKKPMSEIVEDSVSGFLVPPHNHIEFAKKFEMLTDKELRNNMGASGAYIVKNRFSVNTMVNATYETYLSSMKNSS